MDRKIWYIRTKTNEGGPFSDNEIIQLISKGILKGDDEIYMTEMEKWMRVGDSVWMFYAPNNV
ncbi:MAG: DUF4339 domain-containing protein [Erysipelotrichaceae bacterium]|nr:DUF4339 domain-containing protein [Erysipelotrichaceae bacterium]